MKNTIIGSIILIALLLPNIAFSQKYNFEEVDEILLFIEKEVLEKNFNQIDNAATNKFLSSYEYKSLLKKYMYRKVNYNERVEICSQEFDIKRKPIYVEFWRKPNETDQSKFWKLYKSPLKQRIAEGKKFTPASYNFNFREYGQEIEKISGKKFLFTSNNSTLTVYNVLIYDKINQEKIDNLFLVFRKNSKNEWLLDKVGKMEDLKGIDNFYREFELQKPNITEENYLGKTTDLRPYQRAEIETVLPIISRIACGSHSEKGYYRLSMNFSDFGNENATTIKNRFYLNEINKSNYFLEIKDILVEVDECYRCSKKVKAYIENGGISINTTFNVRKTKLRVYEKIVYIDFYF